MAKLDIKYQPVTSQNRIPLVQNGTVDIECGSTTNNATRQKDVSFAVTTFVTEGAHRGEGELRHHLASPSSRQERRHHHRHHLGADCCASTKRANGIDFKEVFGKDHADSFLLLESGRADAFVMDDQILPGNIAVPRTPADFKIVGEVLSVWSRSPIMLRKDDPAFKKAVDDSIIGMMKSGEIGKIYDKWFCSRSPSATGKVAWARTPTTSRRGRYAEEISTEGRPGETPSGPGAGFRYAGSAARHPASRPFRPKGLAPTMGRRWRDT